MSRAKKKNLSLVQDLSEYSSDQDFPNIVGANEKFGEDIKEMDINAIKIGTRFRKDLGDLDQLVENIDELGLLNPVTVSPDKTLIAGERRLEAAITLGWTRIPVRILNIPDIIKGECSENHLRKSFSVSESIAIGRAIEKVESEKAQQRKLSGKPSSESDQGRTDVKVSNLVGMGKNRYRHAKEVVEAAERDPEKFQKLVDQMDKSNNVEAAHRKFQSLVKEQITRGKEEEESKTVHSDNLWSASSNTTAVSLYLEEFDPEHLKQVLIKATSGSSNSIIFAFLQLTPSILSNLTECLFDYKLQTLMVWPVKATSHETWPKLPLAFAIFANGSPEIRDKNKINQLVTSQKQNISLGEVENIASGVFEVSRWYAPLCYNNDNRLHNIWCKYV